MFMKSILAISIWIGFSLVFSSCEKDLDPQISQKAVTDINLVGSSELKVGAEIQGHPFENFVDVWEIERVETATMDIVVQKTIKSLLLAKINHDGSINWIREEKPNFATCAADNMKTYTKNDALIVGYQNVSFNEDGNLLTAPTEDYIVFDFAVEDDQTLKLRGEIPQGLAIIPELGYTIKAGDIVNYTLKRTSNIDVSNTVETELNAELCNRKLKALGLVDSDEEPKDGDSNTPSQDPIFELPPTIDRNEFIQKQLDLALIEVKKGKQDGNVSNLNENEPLKSLYTKFSGSEDKRVDVEFRFALKDSDIDGLNIEVLAKKGRWGQYEPKLNVAIFNASRNKWVSIGGADLFFKESSIQNDLFKNIEEYIIEKDSKSEIAIKLESDLNRLDQCKFFKLLPCTIHPSILVNMVRISSLRNPYRMRQNPECPRELLKGYWDTIAVSTVEKPQDIVIVDGSGSRDLSPGRTVFTVRQNFSAGTVSQNKMHVYVLAKDHVTKQEGWNFCPDKRYNFSLDYENCIITFDPIRPGIPNSRYDIKIYEEDGNYFLEQDMIVATENAYIKMRYRPDVTSDPKAKFKFDCIR